MVEVKVELDAFNRVGGFGAMYRQHPVAVTFTIAAL